ncbi:MAG: protein serine/threonine phosphatase [Bacteroidetes bacterium]|jgi:serine phosphatase RsbU (regulator of sigma subunit)|nr:protein serine/threonine phosphatase [Bacteroidota bacterium]
MRFRLCVPLIFFFLTGFFYTLQSQTKADSLLRVIERSKEPEKAQLYCSVANLFLGKDYNKFYEYASQGLKIASKYNNQYTKAFALRQVGIYYDIEGDTKKSIVYIDSALGLNRKINDEGGIIACLSSLGIVQYNAGNYEKALPLYIETLEYYEKKKNLSLQAYFAGNIGGIYRSLEQNQKAKKYYTMAAELAEKSGNKKSTAIAYNNLGSQLMLEKNFTEAEVYLTKSLKLKEEIGEAQGISYTLHTLAELYDRKKDYAKAKEVAEKSLAISEKLGDVKVQILALEELADINLKLADTVSAEKNYMHAYDLADKSSNMQALSQAAFKLSFINKSRNDLKKALSYYYIYASARDSFISTEKFKAVNEMETKYKTEKKEQQINLLNKQKQLNEAELLRSNAERMRKIQEVELLNTEKEMQEVLLQKSHAETEAKNKENEVLKMDQQVKKAELARSEAEKKQADELSARRTQQLYGLLAVSGLVLVMLFLIYRGYRQKQKANKELTDKNELINQQKKEVEHQKEIVDEKNKEITDSITYAKRLQEAILPPISLIKQYFPESFVLYKPKDIVAGDFYWLETVVAENSSELVFIAAADCTGHGVPGAMVSVVCSNALNRTVKEFNITEPGKILDKVRELVIATFEKSESEVKDGMDISLLCVDKGNKKIFWSGANNPLWFIPPGETQGIREIKADKQPIGKYAEQNPFTTHALEWEPGTTFYMYTDGYADQFGGPKGKKFKYKQLQEIIETNTKLAFEKQADELNAKFEGWKNKLEQIDDVCIIGIRI